MSAVSIDFKGGNRFAPEIFSNQLQGLFDVGESLSKKTVYSSTNNKKPNIFQLLLDSRLGSSRRYKMSFSFRKSLSYVFCTLVIVKVNERYSPPPC